MTRDEIMALSGQKLNAAVAEQVFGKPRWKSRPEPQVEGEPCGTTLEHCKAPLGNHQRWRDEMEKWERHQNGKPVWYSKTMDYAWKVVERMHAQHRLHLALNWTGNMWRCSFRATSEFWHGAPPDDSFVWESAAPQAICRAALLAVAQEVVA